MNICWLAAVFALALISLAESREVRPGPADLVKPLPGVPLSAEQVEERARSLPGGSSTVEITRCVIYRDSAGRVRIERVRPGESPVVSLIDPITGSRVMLSESDKIAYRVMGPKAGETGFAYGFSGMGEGLPPADWTTNKENLGRRKIGGNEFEGTRIIQTEEGGLANKIELWYSPELKLTGSALASGPYGTHTAQIQNLRREEPVPAIFAIPSDYRIVDVSRK